MDWLVIALVGVALTLPFCFASVDAGSRHTVEIVGKIIAALGSVLLISWMWLGDGANSSVWRWLPPFWPWGRIRTGTVSRWCLVVLMVLGTMLGIVFDR